MHSACQFLNWKGEEREIIYGLSIDFQKFSFPTFLDLLNQVLLRSNGGNQCIKTNFFGEFTISERNLTISKLEQIKIGFQIGIWSWHFKNRVLCKCTIWVHVIFRTKLELTISARFCLKYWSSNYETCDNASKFPKNNI